jgi:hypothetical protein
MFNICLFGKEYNIQNLFQINIPDEMEVIKIEQELRINNPDYKEKYMLEGGSLRNIFQLLDILEESLSFTISNINYRKRR